MKKLLLTVITYLSICYSSLGDDSRLIRRLYLDTIKMPPTIEEIDWYTTYNKAKGYEMAVDWVLSQVGDDRVRGYYLSNAYRTKPEVEISADVLDNIIKYQVGNLKLTDNQAVEELIKCGEDQYSSTLDMIDYFAMCMMSRPTHIDEANLLLRVFRASKTETQGYKDTINIMKHFKDYRYK